MDTIYFHLIYGLSAISLMGISMLMLHKSSVDLSKGSTATHCDMGMVNCRLGMTGYLLAALGFALFIFLFPEPIRQNSETWYTLGLKLSFFSIALGIIHYNATTQMYRLFR